jgi:hypothetical protein
VPDVRGEEPIEATTRLAKFDAPEALGTPGVKLKATHTVISRGLTHFIHERRTPRDLSSLLPRRIIQCFSSSLMVFKFFDATHYGAVTRPRTTDPAATPRVAFHQQSY